MTWIWCLKVVRTVAESEAHGPRLRSGLHLPPETCLPEAGTEHGSPLPKTKNNGFGWRGGGVPKNREGRVKGNRGKSPQTLLPWTPSPIPQNFARPCAGVILCESGGQPRLVTTVRHPTGSHLRLVPHSPASPFGSLQFGMKPF